MKHRHSDASVLLNIYSLDKDLEHLMCVKWCDRYPSGQVRQAQTGNYAPSPSAALPTC